MYNIIQKYSIPAPLNTKQVVNNFKNSTVDWLIKSTSSNKVQLLITG